MLDTIRIDAASIVSDVIQKHPTTVGVFNYFGIDACFGGHSTVGAAAESEFVDSESLVDALRAAVRYEIAVSAMSSYEKWRAASCAADEQVCRVPAGRPA